MSYSPTKSPCSNAHVPEDHQTIPINRENLHEKIHGSYLSNQISVEIVSEEEMALLEAALSLAAATRPSSLSPSSSRFSVLCSQLGRNSKRAVTNLAGPSSVCDVEDSGRLVSPNKKCKVPETFLNRFRRKKGLYVTDITATVFTSLWFLVFLVFFFMIGFSLLFFFQVSPSGFLFFLPSLIIVSFLQILWSVQNSCLNSIGLCIFRVILKFKR